MIEVVLRKKGAEIYEGNRIGEVCKTTGGAEVILSNGYSIRTELLILSAGVEPRISFLAGTELNLNRGVLVDKRMRTNIPDVYAAGDVAEASNFIFGQAGVNAITPNAIQQGKVAGSNMAGEEMEDRGWIPMNLFKFFGHTAFSIGLSPQLSSDALKSKEDKTGIYKELGFQDNRLVGARFIDADMDPGIFRYLIEERVDIGLYKEKLLERPQETSRWLMLQAEGN